MYETAFVMMRPPPRTTTTTRGVNFLCSFRGDRYNAEDKDDDSQQKIRSSCSYPALETKQRQQQQRRKQVAKQRSSASTVLADTKNLVVLSRRQFHTAAPVMMMGLSSCYGSSCSTSLPSSSPSFVISSSSTSSTTAITLLRRLNESSEIRRPTPSLTINDFTNKNLYYPSFMEGTWDVEQTLLDVSMPIGLKYAGGPTGSVEIAQRSLDESKAKIGQTVRLKLRYLPSSTSTSTSSLSSKDKKVFEDRLFNTANRLNAFAGRDVVSTVAYIDDVTSTTSSASGNTITRFKGPAIQKTIITSTNQANIVSADDDSSQVSSSSSWVGQEIQRSTFSLINQSTRPPIITDTEIIYRFDSPRGDDESNAVINGQLRIIGYLNPQSDPLYFEARERAVSIQDYQLKLRKVKEMK